MTKYCPKCGAPNEDDALFCSKCGNQLTPNVNNQTTNAPVIGQKSEQSERVFYKGEGTLIIKKTKEKGAGAKAASWLALGPVGYVAFGRDKKSKSKAEGELIVTNKAIYCAGNDYPFDRMLSLTRDGKKTVVINFEKDVAPGGQSDRGSAGFGGVSIEAEIKMDSREACDELFLGLQRAKTSHLEI